MLALHVLVQLHHVGPGEGTELAHPLAALSGVLLKDCLVGALEAACCAVGLVHDFLVGEANFGIQNLQAFRVAKVLAVGLDVLAHLRWAGGGEGALLTLPAETDVV